MSEITLRLNDVYSFRWTGKDAERFEPYHCFDGQLVVRQRHDGELYLHDTYWGFSSGKTFTLVEAQARGELTLKCNLDDVETIRECDTRYYDPNDIIHLSTQKESYKHLAVKKGTERSSTAMLEWIDRHIERRKSEMEYSQDAITRLTEERSQVVAGNPPKYISE